MKAAERILVEQQGSKSYIGPAGDGRRVLRLPEPRHLTDALTGTDHGVTDSLEVEMRRGQTLIWQTYM